MPNRLQKKHRDFNTKKWKTTHTDSNYQQRPVTNLDQGLGLCLVWTTKMSSLSLGREVLVSSQTDRQTSRSQGRYKYLGER